MNNYVPFGKYTEYELWNDWIAVELEKPNINFPDFHQRSYVWRATVVIENKVNPNSIIQREDIVAFPRAAAIGYGDNSGELYVRERDIISVERYSKSKFQ